MKRFIEGVDRDQGALFPERLDDFLAEDNPVRVVEAFVEGLDLGLLGFAGVNPRGTSLPAYHPSVMLKLYIYGYLNRIHSSRRLEREAQRNVELMWLIQRPSPDFKTSALKNSILQATASPVANRMRHGTEPKPINQAKRSRSFFRIMRRF
jgi:transposase